MTGRYPGTKMYPNWPILACTCRTDFGMSAWQSGKRPVQIKIRWPTGTNKLDFFTHSIGIEIQEADSR